MEFGNGSESCSGQCVMQPAVSWHESEWQVGSLEAESQLSVSLLMKCIVLSLAKHQWWYSGARVHEDSLKLGGYVCIVGHYCLKLYSKDCLFLSQVPLAEAIMQTYSLLCPQCHVKAYMIDTEAVVWGWCSKGSCQWASYVSFILAATQSTFAFCFLKLLFLSAPPFFFLTEMMFY